MTSSVGRNARMNTGFSAPGVPEKQSDHSYSQGNPECLDPNRHALGPGIAGLPPFGTTKMASHENADSNERDDDDGQCPVWKSHIKEIRSYAVGSVNWLGSLGYDMIVDQR
jgi:hypothetical protein